jgi:uncharacterized protein (TIGR00251 family)
MALINVKVVPGSSRDRVAGRYGDGVKVQVSAPPEAGRANRAVQEVIAAALGIKAQQVRVVKGHTQARKVVEVEGDASAEEILAMLAT